MSLDNPAARLHALLSAVHAAEGRSVSIANAWRKALGDEEDVSQGIAAVATLLVDLQRVVERAGLPRLTETYEHFAPAWRKAVFSFDVPWNTGSEGLVDPSALAALGGLVDLLSILGSEGTVPEDAAVSSLRSELEAALDEVRNDVDLPTAVKQILVARLHDMLWALDHLSVAGPEGVKQAAERLAGALAVNPDMRREGVVTKVARLAGRAWTLFTFAQKATGAIEGWDKALELLPPN